MHLTRTGGRATIPVDGIPQLISRSGAGAALMRQLTFADSWMARLVERVRRVVLRAARVLPPPPWEQLSLCALWLSDGYDALAEAARAEERATRRARDKARQELVLGHLWVVDTFVAKYKGTAPHADLREAGMLALVEAAARFEAGRVKFATYAWNWVRGHVLGEVRKSHVVPVPDQLLRQARREGKSVDCKMVWRVIDQALPPEQAERIEHDEEQGRIDAALEQLPEGQRAIAERLMSSGSVEELANELDLPAKIVKMAAGNVRARLAEVMVP